MTHRIARLVNDTWLVAAGVLALVAMMVLSFTASAAPPRNAPRLDPLKGSVSASNVSASLSNSSLDATGTVTFTMTFDTTLSGGGQIMVSSSQNYGNDNSKRGYFTLKDATVSSNYGLTVQTSGGNSALDSYDDGRINLQLPQSGSIAAGSVTFSLANVKNPNKSGGYYFDISVVNPNDPPPQEGQPMASTSSNTLLLGTIAFQGKVTKPDGTVVSGSWVNADNFKSGKYGGTSTNSAGEYYIADLESGTYMVSVFASQEDSSLKGLIPPDPVELTYSGSMVTKNLQFQKAASKITAKVVYKGTSTPVTDFQANAFKGEGGGGGISCSGDSTGSCSMAVGNATYNVTVSPPWDQTTGKMKVVNWSYSQPPQQAITNNNEVIITFEVEKATATAKGTIKTEAGACPSNANQFFVDIRNQNGGGSGGSLGSDCTFSIPTPPGKFRLNVFTGQDSEYYTNGEEFDIADNETKTFALVVKQRKAQICGKVTTSAGAAIADQRLNAWTVGDPKTSQNSSGTSDSSGNYCIRATIGEWEVRPDTYGSSYIYSGAPQRVTITKEDEKVTGKDFQMVESNIEVNCNLVDENGNRISNVWGWCYLRSKSGKGEFGTGVGGGNSQPIRARAESGGSTFELGVWVDSNFGYLPGATKEVTYSPGAVATENVTALATDSTISGNVLDNDSGQTITNANGFVFCMAEKNFTHLGGFMQGGTYSMGVRSGDRYMCGIDLKDATGYLSGGGPDGTILTAEKGKVTTHNFSLRKSTRTIRAKLMDPNGNPISFAFAMCENWRYVEQTGTPEKDNHIFLNANSDGNGVATIPAIDGKFDCSAFAGDPGRSESAEFLPPEFVTVTETGDQDITLNFKKSDGNLNGSVKVNGENVQFGFVYAWNPNGGHSGADAFGGTYSMPLAKGTWYAGADSMDTNRKFYRSEEEKVEFTGDASKDFTLEEASGRPIPESQSYSFDVTNAITLKPDDYTSLILPANALGTEGTASCTFSPNIKVTAQAGSHPVENFAWDIDCSISGVAVTTLNSNATLRLCWDQEFLDEEGIDEETIVPETYNEEAGTWQTTTGTLNDESDCTDISLNHFSTYSNNSTAGGTAAQAATGLGSHKDIVATPMSKGGPQVAIWDETGKLKSSWMAYNSNLRMGITVKTADIDDDGEAEVITVPESGFDPQIRIFNTSGQVEAQFVAYSGFRHGISFDIFDVDGDGDMEILTVPAANGTSHVKIFSNTGTLERSFMGYGSGYKGGSLIIATDMEGDGLGEIVLAPKVSSGQIRTFTYTGKVIAQFNAFGGKHKKGIASLTASDLEDDGLNEFIVTPREGGSMVQVFTKDGHVVTQFTPYDKKFTGGSKAYVGDVDNDGETDIVTLPNSSGSAHVRIFTKDGTFKKDFFAYPAKTTRKGTFSMTIGDFDDDGDNEMAFGTGVDLGPQVRIISSSGTVEQQFMALHKGFRGGINLTVVDALE